MPAQIDDAPMPSLDTREAYVDYLESEAAGAEPTGHGYVRTSSSPTCSRRVARAAAPRMLPRLSPRRRGCI